MTSFRPAVLAVLASLSAAMLSPSAAQAGDITGTWLVQDGTAKIKIANCGQALCGNIVWIKDPVDPDTGKPWTDTKNTDASKRSRPLMGLTIASNMRPDKPDRWAGKIYSVDHGRTVDGSLTLLGPTKLRVEGCVMLFCDGENWTRAD